MEILPLRAGTIGADYFSLNGERVSTCEEFREGISCVIGFRWSCDARLF